MILSCCRQLSRPVLRLSGALRGHHSTQVFWQRLRAIQPITVSQQSLHNDQKSQQQHSDTNTGYTRAALAAAAAAAVIGGVYVLLDAQRHTSPQITLEGDETSEQSSSQPASNPISLQEAIEKSDELLQRIKLQKNCPGLVVAVTVDGKNVWSKGYGLADVENVVDCKPSTVMRIASISKPLTMVALARLWEQGKLDLDAPVEQYVPSWPEKTFKGQKVTITTRQLVSMLGGIRHYDKTCTKHKQKKVKDKKKNLEKKDKGKKNKDGENKEKKAKDKEEDVSKEKKAKDKEDVSKDNKEKKDKDDEDKGDKEKKEKTKDNKVKDKDEKVDKEKKPKDKKQDKEFEYREYYIKKHFKNVNAALRLFKDDELCSLPGTEFLYSTYSWTLVSAVIEGASGRSFTDVMRDIFSDLGLENTYLDEETPLIPNRARYYVYDKNQLANAPYVDNSYKWAGGGFISTVLDLCHFGNAMLFSYQALPSSGSSALGTGNQLAPICGSENKLPSGYLRPETVKMLWTPVAGTKCSWDKDGLYAMGWGTVPMATRPGFTRQQRMYVSHTGGAVGASSVLLILPRQSLPSSGLPRGVCVAIIVNTQSVGLNKTALKIAQLFDSVNP